MPSYKEMFANRKRQIDEATGYGGVDDPILKQNEDFKATQAAAAAESAKAANRKENARLAAKKAARKALGLE